MKKLNQSELEIITSAFSESLAWEECWSDLLTGNFVITLN